MLIETFAIMIRGINFFKTSLVDQQINIDQLEESLGLSMPYIYKLFMTYFELGDANLDWQNYLNPQKGIEMPSGSIKFGPLEGKKDLYFNGFFSAKELISDWEIYSRDSKEYKEYGFIRIGDIGVGGGLFLGLNGEFKEGIFRVVWDWDDNYEFLAKNVFEFISHLVFIEDYSNMEEYKYNYDQFYKDWGEEFWRVRE